MRALAILLAWSSVAAGGGDVGGAPPAADRGRQAIASELLRVGAELRREVVAGDTGAILARVPEAGLRCGRRLVPRAKVAADLRSESSWVHGALFGGPGYSARPGAPASLAALLRGPAEVAIVVTFQEAGRDLPEGRPCVDFRAEGISTPGVPFCFERRGERWWLVDSLYPCG